MDDRQMAIAEIQDNLRNISIVTPEMQPVIATGEFDDLTKKNVILFQNMHGIPADGIVDFNTWNMLYAESDRVRELARDPLQVLAISNEDLPLRIGMNNRFVFTLKKMLSYVASKFDNFEDVEINSVFDRQTQERVRQWQFIIREAVTGSVDKRTWNALVQFYLL